MGSKVRGREKKGRLRQFVLNKIGFDTGQV